MTYATTFATASVLAMTVGGAAFAQQQLSGFDQTEEIIEDIEEEAADVVSQTERDVIGPLGVPQGWAGSLALTGSWSEGNTDTSDVSVATRLSYGQGPWTQSFGAALEYSAVDGDQTEETYYATYEVNRALTPQYYAFGLARAEYDRFATNEVDGFAGLGLGVSLPMGPDVDWRLQAGPGVRFIRTEDDFEVTEEALLISSRYTYEFSDAVTLTNDTDVLGSDTNIVATNELGVNYRMTDLLSTRLSYRTEYNSDPNPGFDEFDNTLGVAAVVSF